MRVLLTDPIDPQGEQVLRCYGAEIVNAPVSPEHRVALGIGHEIDENFLAAHPAVEGPGYI